MNKLIKGNVYIVDDPQTHRSKAIDPKHLEIRRVNPKTLEVETRLLGDILDDLNKGQANTQKELEAFKTKYKKNINKLLNIVEILVNQTELNNMNINDLKSIKEEVEND